MENETEAQYIERRIRETQTEIFKTEYAIQQKKRLADAEQALETAKWAAEHEARLKRLASENEHRYISPQDRVECTVCGEMVDSLVACHTSGNDICVRKPREAKMAGRITKDAWDALTEAERNNGYVIKGIIFASDDGSTGTFSPAGKANLLAGLVINPALRRR
jgi:hypothetical protein